jgi:hypothetical protein
MTDLSKVTDGKLIKDSSISDRELNELRERFKIQYATAKGWNPNKLTGEQLNEIYSDKRWKTPGLLFS